MLQLYTWQPLSMCRQNSVRGSPEGWWLSSCRSSVAEDYCDFVLTHLIKALEVR